jgi:hypothetical protein
MPSERLTALAEGLGLSEPPAALEALAEPEHATALRMNVEYFIRTSRERYGDAFEEPAQVAAIEDEILASDRYALSYYEQPREVGAAPPPRAAEEALFAQSLWLDRLVGPELAPIPQVFGDPGFLPENDYRTLVAQEESRRALEEEAPELWISRMRYFEDTFGFRYRATYVDKAGRERRIRSFTPDASEIFRVMTEVPQPDWRIDELAVSCHCDGKGFYCTTRDPANWKDKIHSKKIYALEADRPATKPPGEKCEPFERSLESHAEAFRDLYTPNAKILLLMCWSVRVHNVMLDLACGKDVHYFRQECWISPFKLDLKGWYWDVPTRRPGHSASGPLPPPKDCAELMREFLLRAGG